MTQFSGSSFGRHTRFWLIVAGLFQLGLAAFFIFGLGDIPFAGEGMVVTGAILGVVGVGLIGAGLLVGRRAAATDRILQSGIAGQATITGATQTGMYLNHQPQIALDLSVELRGRAPYAAKHKSFVPLMLLGRIAPGSTLPVRVDPANPQKIVVDWQSSAVVAPMAMGHPMAAPALAAAGAAPGAATVDETFSQVQAALAASGAAVPPAFATPAQGSYAVEQIRDHLRQHGLEGHARIDELTDTGQIVGNERLFTMSLTLELPGQPPEKLPTSGAMVPIAHMHKVRIGARVPVRVAAENHNLTMFEWEKL